MHDSCPGVIEGQSCERFARVLDGRRVWYRGAAGEETYDVDDIYEMISSANKNQQSQCSINHVKDIDQ